MHRWPLLIIFQFILTGTIFGQSDDIKSVAAAVKLDSIIVKATRQGFVVEDFVKLVQEDNTFYRAFKNLRTTSYDFDVDMTFQNRKEKVRARYIAENKQHFDPPCRRMEILSESYEGNFYKRKKNPKFRYYTAKLYNRLFCTEGVVCEGKNDESYQSEDEESQAMEGHVNQLKKLLFSPGQYANVPFIKKKTAIFSEQMRKFYDYKISSDNYRGIDCYVFTASVKPRYRDQPGKTVIKYLSTMFSKEDFQILYRSYRLAHGTVAYKFDVTMNVELTKRGPNYFPNEITYDGYWNVIGKKYEKGTFTVSFSDFQIE